MKEVATFLNHQNIEDHSIIVIYGYRNSFTTLVLLFASVSENLIPFIVESGNLHYTEDLKFNAILTPDPIGFKEYPNIKEISFDHGIIYKNFHKDIYIGSENDFVIVSSSASTSKIPKKILLGKRQTLNNIVSNQKALSISKRDKTLVLLPISYSYGLIGQVLSHLLVGADIFFTNKNLGILQLSALIRKHKITNIFMTPLFSRLFLYYNQNLRIIENSLSFITIGGDKPYEEELKKLQKIFQCPIYGTYGLAEAGPRVATKKFDLEQIQRISL